MVKAKYSKEFPLVGVGASAGGVDSFKKFLGAIPDNSGMAYVLVQHLSPSHNSILPEILRRTSRLPVQEISDDCHLEPDHVYVIPENKLLEVTDHSLNLVPREEGQHHMPIDKFFGSLARSHGKMAIGVVLSGTANDGTAGLREIKEHGGITFAENPESAAWPGMPRSAVEAGVVDFILAPEDIPPKLVKVRANFDGGTEHEDEEERHIDGEGLQKILSVVRQKSGVDFNYYKKPTISRRIGRRMAINQMAHHVDYHELLKDDPKEQELLFQDMLIKVTSFFRDPETFSKLEGEIIPKLLQERSAEDTIRIWVAGCATGEEVFSLAICLFDALEASGKGRYKGPKIQIFASDLSEPVIKKARSGIYSHSELESVSEERRNRYFNRTDGHFRVIKSIRDSVVFTVHNFLKDPPFRNLDLISCRNVFIYLEPFLQKKALSTFHYALKENGFLLLGKSESIAKPSDYFAPYSKNEKIYSRKAGEGRFEPAATAPKQPLPGPADKTEKTSPPPKTDFRKSADRKLVTEYTPASLIVDARYEIVHINGIIEPFVTPQSGRPTHELLKTARKELAFELRNALRKAKESEEKVRKEGVPVKTEWEEFSVDFEIVPLTDIVETHYLILFWKSSGDRSFYEEVRKMLEPVFPVKGKSEIRQRNEALEKELEQLREDMRGISEEQEAYNEELQSANEELLSGNEEMQSLNEELETSKEELESTNEELVVVNRELTEKQEELNDALAYSDDIIASVREPFLVLDADLRIQKTNNSFSEKFDMDEGEVAGQHFLEIQNGQWNRDDLRNMLEKILPKEQKIVDEEMVVETERDGERIFLFNAGRIIREKDSEKLILLEIADITERKTVERNYQSTIEELNRTNEQLDQFVHVASHDLQEPLRKITTFAGRITDKGGDLHQDDLETYLKKIKSASARMSSLIKNLLNFARLAHHDKLFEQTDLNDVLDDIFTDFELPIEQKEAELQVGQLPTIEAIPLQVNQLFYNLVSNALKFSTEGVPPLLSISSRKYSDTEVKERPALDPDLSYYEIVFRDNGIGFSEKYGEQIFTIFQRLNPSSQYLGTGIGLALCKRIAENHHGDIFAESKVGQGAAFHVILPVAQPERRENGK